MAVDGGSWTGIQGGIETKGNDMDRLAYFTETERPGGPPRMRFYGSEHKARRAMFNAMRNGAKRARYGWGRLHGIGDFSVSGEIDNKEAV